MAECPNRAESGKGQRFVTIEFESNPRVELVLAQWVDSKPGWE